MEAQKVTARFQHYDADEITNNMVGVSGWVPAQNVEPLLRELGKPGAFYYTEDGHEAFVCIDHE